ncbi:hypothetical protein QR680_018779 [Steinernema hermaphroditum]|uniref:Tetraspanin n=1 Tax=Steinernema hermaphroditum TaxID=289476 RepID=A0AA39HIZ6_9BILA|nr:hypothetical protein QR680_018779 [Steinernema hermaphroditum]
MGCHVAWIYMAIVALVVSECVLVSLIIRFSTNEWNHLVHITFWDPLFFIMMVSGVCQLLTGLLGIFAMVTGIRKLIIYYYFILLFFLGLEAIFFMTWIFRLTAVHNMHHNYEQVDAVFDEHLCDLWRDVGKNLDCLPPVFCGTNTTLFDQEGVRHCTIVFTKWVHAESDYIAFVTFFVVFPLKIWILMTSQDDIRVMFRVYESPYSVWGSDEEEGFEYPERKLKKMRKKQMKKGMLCTQPSQDETIKSNTSGDSQLTLVSSEKSRDQGSPV